MMNKYIKDNQIINATEKAYKVIYKSQGYIPYQEVETNKIDTNNDAIKDLTKMKKEELMLVALENEIQIPEDVKKEELIKLIKEKLEKKEEANE